MVPAERIAKGAEISNGCPVIVDPDELAPFVPLTTKSIDVAQFVDPAEIDPAFVDTAYPLVVAVSGAVVVSSEVVTSSGAATSRGVVVSGNAASAAGVAAAAVVASWIS